MNIRVKIIPHTKQRYDTCGDWWFDKQGTMQIRVSALPDSRYERLIAVHEIVEAMLCDERGVPEAEVTIFDTEYERRRKLGDTSEPGDSKLSPYYREHQAATLVERHLAFELDVDWEAYEKAVNKL